MTTPAPLIYLFGFPGVGKNTIALEMEKQSDCIAVHNHLLSNALRHVIARMPNNSYTLIESDLHHHTMKAWLNFLEFVEKAVPYQALVFTSVLYQNDIARVEFFDFIRNWAKEQGRPFYPVRLICETTEMEKRLQSENRKHSFKLTDTAVLHNLMNNFTVLEPDDCITLDITHMPATLSAQRILEHAGMLPDQATQ